MRRISVWMAGVLIGVILGADFLGLEFDGNKTAAAEALAARGQVTIRGMVREVSYTEEEVFRIVVAGGEAGRVLLEVEGLPDAGLDPYDLPGRRVEAAVQLRRPEPASNPGTFDYRNYLRTEGIYLVGECRGEALAVSNVERKGFLRNRASVFRRNFFEKLAAAPGAGAETAGLFSGMLFGDKDRLSEELYEGFRDNGTAHILSVSGLHVGVIYGAMMVLMGKRRRSWLAVCLTGLGLSACALLADFSVSVMRAVMMIGLHLLANRIHRRYDILSAACMTAILFLLINPYMLYSTGFLLSFSAVISLSVIGGGLSRRIQSRHPIIKLILPIAAIQLGTAPIQAYIFNSFSLAAFIANIPIIFLSSFLIVLGMGAALLSLFDGGAEALFRMLAEICGFLGDMMIFFNDMGGVYEKLSFSVPSPSVFLMIGFYFLLFSLFSEHRYLHPPGKREWGIFLCAAILLLGCMGFENGQKPELVFVDVGQGDCIHIRTPEGRNYLVDGGGSMFSDYDVGEKVLLPYLLKNGIRHLDGIFITHMDADHYKGIASLNLQIRTGSAYLFSGYQKCAAETAARLNLPETAFRYLGRGSVVSLGRGVWLSVLSPKSGIALSYSHGSGTDPAGDGAQAAPVTDSADFNAASLVMLLEYRGTRILLTGDIGAAEEAALKTDFRCHIIKVPHHGSKNSSSETFVADTQAKAAVIQVGKNNFGHPAESVIERYRKNGIMVFRNDTSGAVLVHLKRSRREITGYKSGEHYEF